MIKNKITLFVVLFCMIFLINSVFVYAEGESVNLEVINEDENDISDFKNVVYDDGGSFDLKVKLDTDIESPWVVYADFLCGGLSIYHASGNPQEELSLTSPFVMGGGYVLMGAIPEFVFSYSSCDDGVTVSINAYSTDSNGEYIESETKTIKFFRCKQDLESDRDGKCVYDDKLKSFMEYSSDKDECNLDNKKANSTRGCPGVIEASGEFNFGHYEAAISGPSNVEYGSQTGTKMGIDMQASGEGMIYVAFSKKKEDGTRSFIMKLKGKTDPPENYEGDLDLVVQNWNCNFGTGSFDEEVNKIDISGRCTQCYKEIWYPDGVETKRDYCNDGGMVYIFHIKSDNLISGSEVTGSLRVTNSYSNGPPPYHYLDFRVPILEEFEEEGCDPACAEDEVCVEDVCESVLEEETCEMVMDEETMATGAVVSSITGRFMGFEKGLQGITGYAGLSQIDRLEAVKKGLGGTGGIWNRLKAMVCKRTPPPKEGLGKVIADLIKDLRQMKMPWANSDEQLKDYLQQNFNDPQLRQLSKMLDDPEFKTLANAFPDPNVFKTVANKRLAGGSNDAALQSALDQTFEQSSNPDKTQYTYQVKKKFRWTDDIKDGLLIKSGYTQEQIEKGFGLIEQDLQEVLLWIFMIQNLHGNKKIK